MGAQVTDLDLLGRWARHGDAEAFNQIAVRHAGMVYSVCRRMLRDAVEAEDAAQECFEKLVQCPEAPREQVGGWLHAVAVSKSLNRLKSRQRRAERETRYASEQGEAADVNWDDLYEHVDEALADLPEAMRTPIVLHFFEGQTHEAIASELGITRSGVTRRIDRGIERLRKSLRGKGVAITTVAALTAGLRGMTVVEAAPVGVLTAAARLALAGPVAPAMGSGLFVLLNSFSLAQKVLAVASLLAVLGVGAWAVWRGQETAPADTSGVAADTGASAGQLVPRKDSAPKPVAAKNEQSLSAQTTSVTPKVDTFLPISNPDSNAGPSIPISGRVVDVNNNGIAGACVEARISKYLEDEFRAMSRNDGAFSITGVVLPTADLHLHAFAGRPGSGLAPIELGPLLLSSDGIENLVLVLHPESTISGMLRDANGQAPKEGAPLGIQTVALSGEERGRLGAVASPNGEFKIRELHAGSYRIFVARGIRGPSFTSYPNPESSEEVTRIELGEAEHKANVVLTYHEEIPLLEISGHIRRQGKPVENERLKVFNEEGVDKGTGEATTDSTGSFVVHGLPPGAYFVRAGLDQWKGVAAGSRDVDLELDAPITLGGHVIRADTRQPITEFELGITSGALETPVNKINFWETFKARYPNRAGALSGEDIEPPYCGIRGASDPNGAFQVSVSPGDMTVYAIAKGFGMGSATVTVLRAEGAGPPEIVIALPPEARVAGSVRNSDGDPVALARIFAGEIPAAKDLERGTKNHTNNDGSFVVQGLPEGTHVIGAYYPGYAPAAATVEAKVGSVTYAELTLVQGGSLEGTVRVAGEYSASCVVEAHYPAAKGIGAVTTRTDESGHFKFERLAPGELEVWVRRPRAGDAPGEPERVERKAVSVEDGKTSTVEFSVAAE